jgi:hypothetical protein
MKMVEERILRFADPELYKKMIETFSAHHIHPYDVQATIKKDEEGYELSLLVPANNGKRMTTRLGLEKESHFNKNVTSFFEKAAAESKSLLMSDYYRMVKP